MNRKRGKGVAGAVLSGLLTLSSVTWAAQAVDTLTTEAAKQFLRRYSELQATQSPSLADLYSDQAIIRIKHGMVSGGKLTTVRGDEYKTLLRQTLSSRTREVDASYFKDVTLEKFNNRVLIHAQRFSKNRCYWDNDYAVVITRERTGWVVIEESMTTNFEAVCPVLAAPNLAPSLHRTPAPSRGYPAASYHDVTQPDPRAREWSQRYMQAPASTLIPGVMSTKSMMPMQLPGGETTSPNMDANAGAQTPAYANNPLSSSDLR